MNSLYSRVVFEYRRVFKAARNSELLVNTSILISGTALAQLIPILLQPVLRRLYSPDTFGAYSVYLSIVGIIAIIASFKYDLAIVLPEKDKTAANVLFLSVLINIAVFIILSVVILIWQSEILLFFNLSADFSEYVLLVPAGVLFYASYQCINNWLIRKKGFLPISINKFTRRGVEGVSQFALNFINKSSGILLGDILGHISNLFSGAIQAKKRQLSFKLVSIPKIKYVINRYSEFPKFNMIPSFMSACSFLLPTIFLNKFYSTGITGYFDLSKLLLSVPLALVSTSISNVLLQKLSESYRAKLSVKTDLLFVAGISSIIVIAEVVIIAFFGIDLFTFIFGEKWEMSGRISQILVWSYALNFIVGSFSAIFISLNRIRLLSIWQILYFSAILSLVVFRNLNFLDFFRVYVLIEVICYLIIIFLMIVIVREYERNIKPDNAIS